MAKNVDIAVMGSGPGGYVAALRAAQLGASVACIEKKYVGGVCLNEGCIPTKAMLRCAEVFETVENAAKFGVLTSAPTIEWSTVLEHRAAVAKQMVRGVGFLLRKADVDLIMGEAVILDPHNIRVTGADSNETVHAENIVIATGSRNMVVPIPGIDGDRVIDHWGAMTLESLPESICIIGGGAIGVEYGSLFNSFGVQVSIVEMLPRLTPLMDESIGDGLAWSLGKKGVDVRTNTRVMRIEHGDAGCRVTVSGTEGEEQIESELVLAAIGRAPNVEGIGLEALGLNPTRKGIQVDSHMATAVPHVYAVGDVAAAGPMLAHVAMHQGEVAVENALGHKRAMDYGAVPSCVFSHPEAAGVGLTEQEAKDSGRNIITGSFDLRNNGKAVALGEPEGFAKVVADADTGAVLGFHCVGPHASDLVLEGTLAVRMEMTLSEIEHTIHAHPTLGEAIHEASLAALGRQLHVPFK